MKFANLHAANKVDVFERTGGKENTQLQEMGATAKRFYNFANAR